MTADSTLSSTLTPAIVVPVLILLLLVALVLGLWLRSRRNKRRPSATIGKLGAEISNLQPSRTNSQMELQPKGHSLADMEAGDADEDAAAGAVTPTVGGGYMTPARAAGGIGAAPTPAPAPAAAAVDAAMLARQPSVKSADPLDIQNFEIAYLSLNVNMDARLGEGAFGMVYLGRWRGSNVAVKQIRDSVLSARNRDEVLAEVRVMAGLKHHANVAQLSGVCVDHPPDIYLVVEYFKLGSLLQALQKSPKQFKPVEVRRQIALDVASGMDYLHSEGILHGDLAARNVLLQNKENRVWACVADFGLAIKLQAGSTATGVARLVPLRWTAPEVLAGTHGYSKAADVWSYGVVLYELHSLGAVEQPYADIAVDADVTAYVVKSRKILPRPKDCPTEDFRIMQQSWAYNPENRPTMSSLVHQLELMHSDGQRS